MGGNKFAEDEIREITKLLRLKNVGNRAKQRLARHDFRIIYEFNISGFNKPNKTFGEEELQDIIQRGAIQILDDTIVTDIEVKCACDGAHDEAAREQQVIEMGEMIGWKAIIKK